MLEAIRKLLGRQRRAAVAGRAVTPPRHDVLLCSACAWLYMAELAQVHDIGITLREGNRPVGHVE